MTDTDLIYVYTKPDPNAKTENGVHPNDPQIWEPGGSERLAALLDDIPRNAHLVLTSPQGRRVVLQVVDEGGTQ